MQDVRDGNRAEVVGHPQGVSRRARGVDVRQLQKRNGHACDVDPVFLPQIIHRLLAGDSGRDCHGAAGENRLRHDEARGEWRGGGLVGVEGIIQPGRAARGVHAVHSDEILPRLHALKRHACRALCGHAIVVADERNEIRVTRERAVVSVDLHHRVVRAADGVERHRAVGGRLVLQPVRRAAGHTAVRRLGRIGGGERGVENLAAVVTAHHANLRRERATAESAGPGDDFGTNQNGIAAIRPAAVIADEREEQCVE